MIKPWISVTIPGYDSSGYPEMEGLPVPRIGEHLILPVWTYKGGKKDTCQLYEGVVTHVTHISHPETPQIWIKLRNLNFFERWFQF